MTPHEHTHECGHNHDHCAHEANRYEQAFAKFNLSLNDETVQAEVDKLIADNIEKYRTPEAIRDLMGTLEITTLTVEDSDESVLAMVEKINKFYDEHPDVPPVATVCTYPNFANLVRNSLEVEGTITAVVSGAFPSSQSFLEVKTVETALAVKDGAEEIDMVLSVGKFFSGDYETVCDEIAEIKNAAGESPLKVILETGVLKTAENIARASVLSVFSGCDFLKTSTGKVPVSATPFAAYVICSIIKEYYKQTGIKIGFKAAGGVNTLEDALGYYTIVVELLGKEWIEERLFRIGTSRLANVMASAVLGEEVKML